MLNEASILKTRRRQKRLILPNFEPWRKPRVHVYFRKSRLTMNRPFPPFCGLKPQTLLFFKSKYHIVSKHHATNPIVSNSDDLCNLRRMVVGIFCPSNKAFAESQRDIGGRDWIETAVQFFAELQWRCGWRSFLGKFALFNIALLFYIALSSSSW